MKNTLKVNAELSRERKPDLSDFNHCKPLRVFAMIKYLTNMNGGHASVIYQDKCPCVILPISRTRKKEVNITLISSFYLYKLKYIASRSKVPSMKFMKHLGIYAHNAKERYNG